MSRTNRLVEDYEYVCKHDPAVDAKRPDFENAWRLYLEGMGECPLKPGEKPKTLTLRILSEPEQAYIRETFTGGDGQRAHGATMAAAMIGLVGIAGLEDEDGQSFKVRHEVSPWGLVRIRHATADSISAVIEAFGGGDAPIFDIGNHVFNRSRLRPS